MGVWRYSPGAFTLHMFRGSRWRYPLCGKGPGMLRHHGARADTAGAKDETHSRLCRRCQVIDHTGHGWRYRSWRTAWLRMCACGEWLCPVAASLAHRAG